MLSTARCGPSSQTSTAFDNFCSLTAGDAGCQAVANINEDMSCAAASASMLQSGAELSSVVHAAQRPPFGLNADETQGGASGAADTGVVTITLYDRFDPEEGDVGFVGCNFFAANGPVSTFADGSSDPASLFEFEDPPVICADALQAQADQGRSEGSATSVIGRGFPIVGDFDGNESAANPTLPRETIVFTYQRVIPTF